MTKASPFEDKRLALFDLDGTLRKVRPSSLDALVSYSTEHDLKFSAKARRKAIRWSHKFWATNDRVRHDIDSYDRDAFLENYLALYLKALGLEGPREKTLIQKIIRRFREEFKPEPYLEPGAKALLWALREAGLTVGLVSNRDNPLTGLAIEMGIIEHFHFTLAAGQVKIWKPEPGIFEHSLRLGGGVAPDEAVYIGDNYFTDIVGARKVGMTAVLIDEEGAFQDKKDECRVISKLSKLKKTVPDKSDSK